MSGGISDYEGVTAMAQPRNLSVYLDSLEKELQFLNEQLDRFGVKAEIIMVPELPESVDTMEKGVDIDSTSPVGRRIQAITRQLGTYNRLLSNLVARIET